MGFLSLLAIYVAFAIISVLLMPKPKVKTSPGDFRPPEPREGEPIPVAFGTVLISPAVTWFGDVQAKKVKKTVSTMAGLIKDEVPLGYEYYAGIMFVICHGPIDAVLDIHIGEKRVVRTAKYIGTGAAPPAGGYPSPSNPTLPEYYPESGYPTRVGINLPKLFGGKEEGGGIVGEMDICWGSTVQPPNDYLATWWGVDIVPNYREICYVVLRRMNLGKSPSVQPWRFAIKRIPDVLGQPDYATITDDDSNETANAAEVLYEILTDDVWGLGKPPGTINKAAFVEVGQTLYDEGLGFNGTMMAKGEAWQTISDILRHIDGVMYQDPLTGLITLKLIRNDYTVGNLVDLDETNSVIEQFTRGSWGESVNESQVKYTDIARRFSDGVAQAQNLAAIQAMDGEVISNTYELKGLSTHELAQAAAERINRTTSVPLNRFRLRTNRIAYAFHPGKPFKLSSTEYGITDMVCRVVSVNYGSLVAGEMEINAVQDVWDLSGLVYASPDDLEDLEPCGPLPLILPGYDSSDEPRVYYSEGLTKMFEVPYWHVSQARRVWVCQSKAKEDDAYWEAWVSIQAVARTQLSEPVDFVPTGTLDEEMTKGDPWGQNIEFTVHDAGDLDSLTDTDHPGMLDGERMLMIDDEIFAWTTIIDLGAGQYRIGGVMRAVADTVPANHLPGAPVFFYYNAAGGESAKDLTAPDDLDEGDSVYVWPVIVDAEGAALPPEQVTPVFHVVGERAYAPAPPGDVRLDGYGYDEWPSSTTGDVTLTWAHRSNTEPGYLVVQENSQNYTLIGTLKIEVLLDGESVREWTGLTGNSQIYTYAQRTSDDADLTKRVEFRITPIGASSEEGTVRVTPPFTMESS